MGAGSVEMKKYCALYPVPKKGLSECGSDSECMLYLQQRSISITGSYNIGTTKIYCSSIERIQERAREWYIINQWNVVV